MPAPEINSTLSSSSKDSRRGKLRQSTNAYRGFSTSFGHSFVEPIDEKGDTCSLACCGMLQMERNRFLLGATAPSLFAARFSFLVVLPIFVFAAGLYLVNQPHQRYRNYKAFHIGVFMLSCVAIYVILRLLIKCIVQMSWRRELLKQKYAFLKETDELPTAATNEDEYAYLMGQTYNDLMCAHVPCGWYRGDIAFRELEAPLPQDLCSCLWQFQMACCCEFFRDCIIQCCGICAVAQESRDIDKIYPPHRRAIDYITMQPVLEYYSYILEHRTEVNRRLLTHLYSISKLSLHIIQSFVIAGTAAAAFCMIFGVWMQKLQMAGAVFAASVIFIWIVHRAYTRMMLSVDALIKAYGSGFYIASTLALPFLVLVYATTELIMYLTLKFDSSNDDNDNDDYVANNNYYGYAHSSRSPDSMFFAPWKIGSGFLLSKKHPLVFLGIFFVQSFVVAFIEELVKYLAFRMISDHPDFWTRTDMEKLLERTLADEEDAIVDMDSIPHIYVETHVRPLWARCDGTVVTMMSLSLGFAVAENILYACIFKYINTNWWALLIRAALMSIHPVCAALQAIGVCQRNFELKVYYKVGMIIRPAVIAHAFFDFAIVVGDLLGEREFSGHTPELITRFLLPFIVLMITYCCTAAAFKSLRYRLDDKDADTIDIRNTWTWGPVGITDVRHTLKYNEKVLRQAAEIVGKTDNHQGDTDSEDDRSSEDENETSARSSISSRISKSIQQAAEASHRAEKLLMAIRKKPFDDFVSDDKNMPLNATEKSPAVVTSNTTSSQVGAYIQGKSSNNVAVSDRAIKATKSLDEILKEIRERKSAVTFTPGNQKIEENAPARDNQSAYTPPEIKDDAPGMPEIV